MSTAPLSLTAWTTLAALLLYFWTFYNVGRARGKFQVKAPLMDGPPAFLHAVRVQANTVEQLVLFLPALWLCAVYQGDRTAAGIGAIWVVGRLLYALGYYRNPASRGPGFIIALAASVALMVASAVGLLRL